MALHQTSPSLQSSAASCRCKSDEFNANGQLFFQPLLQAMRTMIHLGETLPDSMTNSFQISAEVLLLWATTLFLLMLATFGIGAASGKDPKRVSADMQSVPDCKAWIKLIF